MAWRELRFICDAARAEAMGDALLEAGALSVSVEDANAGTADEKPLFGEPGSAVEAGWQRNGVVALFDASQGESTLIALVAGAARAAGLAAVPPCTFTNVEQQDWVRLTQSQFDPIRISKRLWIVPTWHNAPDPNAISIRLDPGLAFGTGSHPTTRMCLAWLDAHVQSGRSVLDYGCGSGVLAIAAALLGAHPVAATDIDAQALIATRDNAAANGCAVMTHAAGALPPGLYETVVANILTNPLKVMAPALAARVRPGGQLTLSGILKSQADVVIAAYAPFIQIGVWRCEEGWVCLSGTQSIQAGRAFATAAGERSEHPHRTTHNSPLTTPSLE